MLFSYFLTICILWIVSFSPFPIHLITGVGQRWKWDGRTSAGSVGGKESRTWESTEEVRSYSGGAGWRQLQNTHSQEGTGQVPGDVVRQYKGTVILIYIFLGSRYRSDIKLLRDDDWNKAMEADVEQVANVVDYCLCFPFSKVSWGPCKKLLSSTSQCYIFLCEG